MKKFLILGIMIAFLVPTVSFALTQAEVDVVCVLLGCTETQKDALQQLVTEPEKDTLSCDFVFTRNLSYGMQGTDVSNLQKYLSSTGDFTQPDPAIGYYGSETIEAVQRYQSRLGIVTSGTPETTGYGSVGPKTREALNARCILSISTINGVDVSNETFPYIEANQDGLVDLRGSNLRDIYIYIDGKRIPQSIMMKSDSRTYFGIKDTGLSAGKYDVNVSTSDSYTGKGFDFKLGIVGATSTISVNSERVSSEVTYTVGTCNVDVSGGGKVDQDDVDLVKSSWNKQCLATDNWCDGADVNHDGFVGIADLDQVLGSLGEYCLEDTATASFKFKLTAVGGQVNLDKSSPDIRLVRNSKDTVESYGWVTDLSSTADSSSNNQYYVIKEGDTENFTLTIKALDLPAGDYTLYVNSYKSTAGNVKIGMQEDIHIGSSPTSSITVLSPNGGEKWALQSQHTISWTPDPHSDDVVAYLEKIVNGQYKNVGEIMPSLKGSIIWSGYINSQEQLADPDDGYYVRIENTKTGASDRSDNSFLLGTRDELMGVEITNINGKNPDQTFAGFVGRGASIGEDDKSFKIEWSSKEESSLCTIQVFPRSKGQSSYGPEIARLENRPYKGEEVINTTEAEYYLAQIGCQAQDGSGNSDHDWVFVWPFDDTTNVSGDINKDGFVGIEDQDIILGNWNKSGCSAANIWCSGADINKDGLVGLDDLNTVLGNWNRSGDVLGASNEVSSDVWQLIKILLETRK